jgi:hypothetical protein
MNFILRYAMYWGGSVFEVRRDSFLAKRQVGLRVGKQASSGILT